MGAGRAGLARRAGFELGRAPRGIGSAPSRGGAAAGRRSATAAVIGQLPLEPACPDRAKAVGHMVGSCSCEPAGSAGRVARLHHGLADEVGRDRTQLDRKCTGGAWGKAERWRFFRVTFGALGRVGKSVKTSFFSKSV